MQQNASAPRTPLWELTAPPEPLTDFKGPLCGGRRRKGEGRGGVKGKEGRGREGRDGIEGKLEQGRRLAKAGPACCSFQKQRYVKT